MGDLLGNSTSGLISFQRSLATTSHNISNVNTEGYSRQRVGLATRSPQPTGAGFIGNGVEVFTVERVVNQFAIDQLREHTSLDSYLQTYHTYASHIDNLLADPDAGLAPAVQKFFDAVQGVADNPSSIPARQVLLSQGTSLIDRFKSIESRMANLQEAVNGELEGVVDEVNAYARSIAKLNKDIIIATDLAGGQPPNDLLDQRDELLRQLAERVPVSAVPQDNGAVNVFIGKGEVLVLNQEARGISATQNEYDASILEVTSGSSNNGVPLSNQINSGTLGALIDFRTEMLDPSLRELGRIAVAIADQFNTQQNLGLDLNDTFGKDFFSVDGLSPNGAPLYAARGNNSSAAEVTMTIDDVSKITNDSYRIETDDGTNLKFIRESDSAVLDTFNVGVFPFTYSSATEGFSFTIDSQTNGGDSFQLQPTAEVARNISIEIDNAKEIAAAHPLRTEASFLNVGTGETSYPEVTDIGLLESVFPVSATIRLEADPADPNYPNIPFDRYTTDGGVTWLPYTIGTPITTLSDGTDQGWSVTVSGEPLVGDEFVIEANFGAVGDNRNALALAELQEKPILDSGSNTFQSAYGQMVSGVGSKTHQLDINAKSQEAILAQAEQTREAVSGVNLDEEAANLVKFQQAYQATAQLINTAQSLFDTLLNAVAR